MALVSNPKSGDDVSVRQAIARLGSTKLGPVSTPTFAGVTTTTLIISGLTTNALIYPVSGLLTSLGVAANGQIPIGSTGTTPVLATISGVANEIDITNSAGTITIGLVNPLIVAKGGTGAATFTPHSLLVGSGTGAFTAIGVAANGKIPIGSAGADPVLATITGTAKRVTVTNGAGTITLSGPQDLDTVDSPTFAGLTVVNAINEFSTDGTMGGNSDSAVPTEKATKLYTDTLRSDLASTANAKGASLVGVEDSASQFDATNVETALSELMVLVTPVEYNPTMTRTAGGDAGGNDASVATIDDADSYDTDEVGGTPGFDIQAVFSGVTDFNQVQIHTAYDGNPAHVVRIDLDKTPFNWSSYDTILADIDDSSGDFIFNAITVASAGQYINSSEVRLRFYHSSAGNATHDFFIDYCALWKTGASVGVTEHGGLTGLDDVIDHPSYLLLDGSRALAGAWDMGSQALTNVNIDSGDIHNDVTHTQWDAAVTHISNDGSDHSFIDQAVTIAGTPTFDDLIITTPVNIYALSHDSFAGFAANEHYLQSAIIATGTIATGVWEGTDVGIAQGGTGQSTAQLGINALSAVSGATNEHVLTKDTGTGNAIWKASAGGVSTWIALTDTDPANFTGSAGKYVKVNVGETGLDFGSPTPGAGDEYVDVGDPAAYHYTLANFITDGTWRDWDLSGIVGSQVCLVHFVIRLQDNAVGSFFLIRENGNSNVYNKGAVVTGTTNVEFEDVWCLTDSNGIVEYYGSNLAFTSIDVVIRGWFVASGNLYGKAKVDVAATADYLGAAFNDGVLRTGAGLSYADGGNFITLTADVGIADDKIMQVDDADAADNDYAKFTANGLEGRDFSEVLGDLSGQAGAAFAWNNQNLIDVGTIGCGIVTGTGVATFEGVSVTIGKASATTGTLVLHDSNSANTITLTVPDISAGSLSFTLPPTDGANTNVLQTDGNGVLTWAAAGGTGHSYTDRGNAASDFDEGDTPTFAAWTDLDLGPGGLAIVPVGAVAISIHLRVKDTVTGQILAVRKNGTTTAVGFTGAAITQVANIPAYNTFVVGCDANGVIEYYVFTGVDEFDIVVLGWWA